MNTLQASLLALALAFAGMTALAFAMARHHEQLTGAADTPVTRGRLLRCAGALLLAAAAMPCLQVWSLSVGVVAWLGLLSTGALGVVALISAAPRWTAAAACTLVVGAVSMAFVWSV